MLHVHFLGGPLDGEIMQVTDIKDGEPFPPRVSIPVEGHPNADYALSDTPAACLAHEYIYDANNWDSLGYRKVPNET